MTKQRKKLYYGLLEAKKKGLSWYLGNELVGKISEDPSLGECNLNFKEICSLIFNSNLSKKKKAQKG